MTLNVKTLLKLLRTEKEALHQRSGIQPKHTHTEYKAAEKRGFEKKKLQEQSPTAADK